MTDEQQKTDQGKIEDLLTKARAEGDEDMVLLCSLALSDDPGAADARRMVQEVLDGLR